MWVAVHAVWSFWKSHWWQLLAKNFFGHSEIISVFSKATCSLSFLGQSVYKLKFQFSFSLFICNKKYKRENKRKLRTKSFYLDSHGEEAQKKPGGL